MGVVCDGGGVGVGLGCVGGCAWGGSLLSGQLAAHAAKSAAPGSLNDLPQLTTAACALARRQTSEDETRTLFGRHAQPCWVHARARRLLTWEGAPLQHVLQPAGYPRGVAPVEPGLVARLCSTARRRRALCRRAGWNAAKRGEASQCNDSSGLHRRSQHHLHGRQHPPEGSASRPTRTSFPPTTCVVGSAPIASVTRMLGRTACSTHASCGGATGYTQLELAGASSTSRARQRQRSNSAAAQWTTRVDRLLYRQPLAPLTAQLHARVWPTATATHPCPPRMLTFSSPTSMNEPVAGSLLRTTPSR